MKTRALSLNRLAVSLALGLALASAPARAATEASTEAAAVGAAESGRLKDRLEPLPKRLEGIDLIEHLDADVPRDLGFADENGQPVMLGDYFKGDVPVILTLNYSDCPMLCSIQLSGLVNGLKGLGDWTAGNQFRIVTVSLNPAEVPATAHRTQTRYLQQYGHPEAAAGWHFLTGSEYNIRQLASALGFQYGYNEERKEYVHTAAIVLTTPNARISRYLYGVEYLPKTLKLSLVEASQGKIGSPMDRLLLYCFYYDSSEGRYAPMARNIMSIGGAVAVTLLGAFLTLLWRGELRKNPRRLAESTAQ